MITLSRIAVMAILSLFVATATANDDDVEYDAKLMVGFIGCGLVEASFNHDSHLTFYVTESVRIAQKYKVPKDKYESTVQKVADKVFEQNFDEVLNFHDKCHEAAPVVEP